jgi:peptidoglycan/xylan/chitin deacetylase (PgdA/CDA1 family)
MLRTLALLVLSLAPALPVAAACPDPNTLGTARVLAVDAGATPRVGRKHFPATLPLGPKEVVLTFDDGPWPGTTARVLDALKRECVQATFFMLGRNASAYPELARRALAEGHTIGHHTYAHPLLNRMPPSMVEAEIDHGIAAVETVLYGPPTALTVTPFFRFPGFAATPALLDRLSQRGMVVFGADFWASDWNPMSPDQELQLILGRLAAIGGGIVLFHDTRSQTAAMLPDFLWELKYRGYRIVHLVPARGHVAGLSR